MVANDTRASSSTDETFWKKSFQTSTGYVVWPSSEHFISVAKLWAVRFVALEKNGQDINERVSELVEICVWMVT